MLHNIDSIRLSEKQKTQLTQLKKKTRIGNWNVLCRRALCLSLAESTTPPIENIPSDSNVEMSWKGFGGEHADVYLALLRQAYKSQSESLNNIHFHDFFKLHLNRGISFYHSQVKSL